MEGPGRGSFEAGQRGDREAVSPGGLVLSLPQSLPPSLPQACDRLLFIEVFGGRCVDTEIVVERVVLHEARAFKKLSEVA